MLNLRKPYPASDKQELINKVYNQPFDKMRPGICSSLQNLITQMLKKDPARRPTIEDIIFSNDF